ncbi:MAG: hypothetical protein RLZZ337_1036 [Bacteroidota bacterium]|jgi:uncharacterized membrane protein YqgA involved in biofilm formation
MNPIIRNVLAVIAGIVIGSVVNMFLVNLNGSVMPLPEGADISTMEKLKESIKFFEPKHYLFPFLGHAIGTLVGAFLAAKIAGTYKPRMAMIIGIFFLAGGIANIFMLGGPLWFNAADIILAYLPMAWLGAKFAGVYS